MLRHVVELATEGWIIISMNAILVPRAIVDSWETMYLSALVSKQQVHRSPASRAFCPAIAS